MNEIVARVLEIIRNNRQLTIREVAEDVEISYGSCLEVMKRLRENVRGKRPESWKNCS